MKRRNKILIMAVLASGIMGVLLLAFFSEGLRPSSRADLRKWLQSEEYLLMRDFIEAINDETETHYTVEFYDVLQSFILGQVALDERFDVVRDKYIMVSWNVDEPWDQDWYLLIPSGSADSTWPAVLTNLGFLRFGGLQMGQFPKFPRVIEAVPVEKEDERQHN